MLANVRTGILGGTFDPIHVAHLHAADCARHALRLDRVLIMPAGDPWQKSGRVVSPASDRLAMCRLAVADAEGIRVDEREVGRDGPTYTVDTLASFPEDEELFLILGADAASGLASWHRWESVVGRASIVIAPRPGVEIPDVEGGIVLDTGLLEVSGTAIRKAVSEGGAWRFLVPPSVRDYISTHDLYTKSTGRDRVVESESMESSS